MKKIFKLLIAALVAVCFSCEENRQGELFADIKSLPAASFMEQSEPHQSWSELLKYTHLFNSLNLNANYTIFAPDNAAVAEYLAVKGVTSVSQLDMKEAINLVKFHLILSANKKYATTDFMDGAFPDTTASGDYLSLEMRIGGMDQMYVNGVSRIKQFNIRTTNSIIHTIEKVLTPITGTIMDNLDRDRFSIFIEMMEQTGHANTLRQIEQMGIKYRYTLFAVPNSVFAAKDISSITQFAAFLGETRTDYTDPENKVYRTLLYHTLEGNHSFANLNEGLTATNSLNTPTLAANTLISRRFINDIFYLNYLSGHGIQITEKNINAKNGVVHVIDDILEVRVPTPAKVTWDLTDYAVLSQYCPKFKLSGQSANYTYNIGWYDPTCYTASHQMYQYFLSAQSNTERYKAVNRDYLVLNMGIYNWIECTGPTIISGTYDVVLAHFNFLGTAPSGLIEVQIDGKSIGTIPTKGADKSKDQYLNNRVVGTVTFSNTEAHKVRFIMRDSQYSYLDCLIFNPQ